MNIDLAIKENLPEQIASIRAEIEAHEARLVVLRPQLARYQRILAAANDTTIEPREQIRVVPAARKTSTG